MRRFALTATLPLALLGASNALAYGDGSESYRELHGSHVIVHYPVSREAFAIRTLQIAEEAHQQLAPVFEIDHPEVTHIVLDHDVDDANGWARVVNSNEIHLYPYPPKNTEELGNYDDWMRLLIYHEYTHILHMDTSDNGFYTVLNAVFGKFARGNATLPRWFTEGLAVYFETQTSQGGRLRSPLYRTMMRNAALDGKIPSLAAMSVTLVDWPAGSAQYLFGAFFIEWLANTYGQDAIIQFVQAYSRQIVPFAINRVALRVFGKTIDDLWLTWQKEITQQAIHERFAFERIAAQNHSTQLVQPHRHNYPQARPNADAFVYYHSDGYHRSELSLYDLNHHTQQKLTECWGPCAARWNDSGEILFFAHSTTQDGYIQRVSLYAYDMHSGSETKLTDDIHLRTFDVAGNWLYVVAQTNESTLILRTTLQQATTQKNLNTSDFELIYTSNPFEQIDSISVYNKDGHDKIAVSRFDPNTQYNEIAWAYVEELKTNTPWHSLPTEGGLTSLNPEWSKSGQELYYISDFNGAFQRYTYMIQSDTLIRNTHLLSGMINPTTLDSGDVVFVQYTSSGLAIAKINADDLYKLPVNLKTPPKREPKELPQVSYDIIPDRPWRWMFPKTWMPSFAASSNNNFVLGMSFAGRDYMDHHNYTIAIDYNSRIDSFDFSMTYNYMPLLWNLSASLNFYNDTSSWFNGKRNVEYEYQTASGSFTASRTLNNRLLSHVFTLGANIRHTQSSDRFAWSLSDPAGMPPRIPTLGWQNALTFNYRLSNLRQYEKSLNIGDGQQLSTSLRFEAPWLGAQYYLLTASFDFQSYWTMPWLDTHTLGIQIAAGTSYAQNPNRAAYSLSTDTTFNLANVLSGAPQNSSIHGYLPRSLIGQHYFYTHAEYNFGILDPIWGTSTLPLGIQRISAGIFADWGYAWFSNAFNLRDSLPAVGAVLHFDVSLGYRLIQRVSIGYAYGDIHQIYFGLF